MLIFIWDYLEKLILAMVSSAGILVTGSLPRKQTPDETPEDCIRRMEKERNF